MKIITLSAPYLQDLQRLIEPRDNLPKHGFILQPLTDEELLLKRRCLGCGKALSQLKGRERANLGASMMAQAANSGTGTFLSNRANVAQPQNPKSGAIRTAPKAKAAQPPQFQCRFHPGEVRYKYWTCCKQHCSAEPCSGADSHNPTDERLADLAEHHQLYFTSVIQYECNRIAGRGPKVRTAVALDCEMGTAMSGDTELIKVTLIDYFTDEILLDHIVEPDVPMRHLNTKYSGVTWGHFRAARRDRTLIRGTTEARNRVLDFVDAQTIVVGHGVNNDLKALKWIHDQAVDSLVIELNIKQIRENKERKEKEAADAKAKADGTYVELVKIEKNLPDTNGAVQPQKKKKKKGDLSLRTLTEKRLGRKIQLGEGTTGHDSLEDAIAARDLVHWHICNRNAEPWWV